jgi:hypothetical protein
MFSDTGRLRHAQRSRALEDWYQSPAYWNSNQRTIEEVQAHEMKKRSILHSAIGTGLILLAVTYYRAGNRISMTGSRFIVCGNRGDLRDRTVGNYV